MLVLSVFYFLVCSGRLETATYKQYAYIPKFCDVLFNSDTGCSPVFIREDIICLTTNDTVPNLKSSQRDLLSQKKKIGNIEACLTWTGVSFITVKGQKCIQKTSLGRRTTGNLTVYRQTTEVHHITDTIKTSPDNQSMSTVASCSPYLGHPTDNHNFSLHRACEEGDLCLVQVILYQKLTDINVQNEEGKTPVMSAAVKGQAAVFHFLVKQGCDLLAVAMNNNTILHEACAGGNVDIVRFILKSNLYDTESKGVDGYTPVMIALYYGHITVVKYLEHIGCNLAIADIYGNTLLHVTSGGGHVEAVRYVISKGIFPLDSKGAFGSTPVIYAAYFGHTAVVKYLQHQGCNMRAVDSLGDTVLHKACAGGFVDLVKYILQQGMLDIDIKGNHARTPVMKAAFFGHVAVVKYLTKRGCRLRVADGGGNNLLHLACIGGHVDMVKYVISKHIGGIESRGIHGMTPVMLAVYCGHTRVVKFLEARGSKMTVVDILKRNILHLACVSGHVDLVKYISSRHIVSIESRGINLETPVMYAAFSGHIPVVEFLRNIGCELTAVDRLGNNILHLACQGGHLHMVQYLLTIQIVKKKRRDKNILGLTPAKTAKKSGNARITTLLND